MKLRVQQSLGPVEVLDTACSSSGRGEEGKLLLLAYSRAYTIGMCLYLQCGALMGK